MRKTNEGASPVRPVLFGAAAGLLATLVLMLVCAVLVHQRTLGEELIPTISLACLVAGCMLASFLAAHTKNHGQFFDLHGDIGFVMHQVVDYFFPSFKLFFFHLWSPVPIW